MNADLEELYDEIDRTLQELVDFSQQTLLKCGRRIIPHLTSDDILQPNDFSELENHPVFRYEEGVLAGVQSALTAFRAHRKKINNEDQCDR